jgi:hypothetical protein
MIKFPRIKYWLACGIVICLFVASQWFSPVAALPNTPHVAQELINLPTIPLEQFPAVPCTNQLLTQFNEQAKIPFSCNLGELVPPEKVLSIGNLATMGITQSSLWQLANVNNINLNNVGADQLQSFYGLITPNKLLNERFGDFYQNQVLGNIPLVQEALIQNITNKLQVGDLSQLQPLNNLLREVGGVRGFADLQASDLLNTDQLRQKLSNLALGKVVAALPEFGGFSLANLPTNVFQSFSVTQAIPALVNQSIGRIAGVESLMIGDFSAVGVPKLSLSQLPDPIALVSGVNIGVFDLPLSGDEKDLGRQISGGIPNDDYRLRKQDCSDKCKFAEISAPNTSYHGSTWVDGNEHWVPDGFGLVCWAWPGGCKGPAGNNPFGSKMRLLLTNIDASAGTAQVSFTFPVCWNVSFVGIDFGTTCTPSIFPIPSGIPIYTIHEGQGIPFVPPVNYGDRSAKVSPTSPDRLISRST